MLYDTRWVITRIINYSLGHKEYEKDEKECYLTVLLFY